MSLTLRQKQYIWLMGSYRHLVMVQGRGKRDRDLLYAVDEDAEELVIFGYSNPPYWLVQHCLIRPLQAPNTYTLTGAGDEIFEQLQAAGGMDKDGFRIVRVKPSTNLAA